MSVTLVMFIFSLPVALSYAADHNGHSAMTYCWCGGGTAGASDGAGTGSIVVLVKLAFGAACSRNVWDCK